MSSHQCPECGRQLKPNAQFCSYCGVSLVKRKEPVSTIQETTTSPEVSQASEPIEEIASIPLSVEAALIFRGKLETLFSQKAALDEELETVKVKQLVGELTETEAKKQSAKLQARLSPITKEVEELESKAQTPLERLQQDKKVQEGRIQRLEDLKKAGEVEDAIYTRLSSEYQEKLSELDQQLGSELSKANHWLAQLENKKQQLEFDRETMQIRARIDEVSKRDVKKQLKTIDEEINKLNSIIVGLRSILGSEAPSPKPSTSKPLPPRKGKTPQEKPASNLCTFCQAQITPGSKYCYTCGRLLAS